MIRTYFSWKCGYRTKIIFLQLWRAGKYVTFDAGSVQFTDLKFDWLELTLALYNIVFYKNFPGQMQDFTPFDKYSHIIMQQGIILDNIKEIMH